MEFSHYCRPLFDSNALLSQTMFLAQSAVLLYKENIEGYNENTAKTSLVYYKRGPQNNTPLN